MENIKKKQYNKTYYDSHRAKIIEHLKTKVLCEVCQKQMPLHYRSKHNQTNVHLRKVEEKTVLL